MKKIEQLEILLNKLKENKEYMSKEILLNQGHASGSFEGDYEIGEESFYEQKGIHLGEITLSRDSYGDANVKNVYFLPESDKFISVSQAYYEARYGYGPAWYELKGVKELSKNEVCDKLDIKRILNLLNKYVTGKSIEYEDLGFKEKPDWPFLKKIRLYHTKKTDKLIQNSKKELEKINKLGKTARSLNALIHKLESADS
jgi:hypothetical protein